MMLLVIGLGMQKAMSQLLAANSNGPPPATMMSLATRPIPRATSAKAATGSRYCGTVQALVGSSSSRAKGA